MDVFRTVQLHGTLDCQHVTGKTFNVHDALTDTQALQEILTDERFKKCLAARKKCKRHSHCRPHAEKARISLDCIGKDVQNLSIVM